MDDLDVGKLNAVAKELKKLSNVVKNGVAKNIKFNTVKKKVNKLEKKIPDATTLIDNNQYNTDKQNLEKKLKMLIRKYQIQGF